MTVAIQSNEKLYTTKAAAEYLGLSLDTIRKYIQRGSITPLDECAGNGYLIEESELKRYLKESKDRRGNPAFLRRN